MIDHASVMAHRATPVARLTSPVVRVERERGEQEHDGRYTARAGGRRKRRRASSATTSSSGRGRPSRRRSPAVADARKLPGGNTVTTRCRCSRRSLCSLKRALTVTGASVCRQWHDRTSDTSSISICLFLPG
jgi:hypothetical protein